MPVQAIVLIVWFTANLILSVVMIGRTVTHSKTSAIISLIVYPLLIWAVVSIAS